MKKLFHGKNSHLSQLTCKNEFNLLAKQFPEFEKQIIDADQVEIDSVAETYKNISMFSNGKVILIRRLSENKRYSEIIEDLKNSEIENVHLFFLENSKVASNTKYFKLFNPKDEIVESPDLNKRTYITWLKEFLKKNNVEFDSESIYQFAQTCNYDTERASNEIDKYLTGGIKKLTREVIEELTPNTFESNIWDLIEVINSSDGEKEALTILENLFEHNTDPYYIVAMLNRNLRLIVEVKDLMLQGKESKEICSLLKIPPFTLPQIKNNANRYSMDSLITLYEKITNMDFETKIGNLEPKVGLTLMIILFEKYLLKQ
jgi:DNA polymerase III subunit delta